MQGGGCWLEKLRSREVRLWEPGGGVQILSYLQEEDKGGPQTGRVTGSNSFQTRVSQLRPLVGVNKIY